MRAVAKSQGAESAIKSPYEDIRSAPALNYTHGHQRQKRTPTTSTGVRGSEGGQWFLQIIHPIDLLFGITQLQAYSRARGRDMLEGRRRRKPQSLL